MFSVLVSLLGVTYFLTEVNLFSTNSDSSLSIDRSKELKSLIINGNKFIFENNKGLLHPGQIPVDLRKLNGLLEVLGKVEVLRTLELAELTEIEKNTIEKSFNEKLIFEFKNSRETFILGALQKFDESFYIKHILEKDGVTSTNINIARANIPRTQAYNNNKPDSSDRYKQIKKLFNANKSLLLDLRVFKDLQTISYLEVKNKRNRPFKIDLHSLTTTPSKLQGIEYHEKKLRKLEEVLKSLNATNIYAPDNLKTLEIEVSSLFIKGEKDFNLKLFKRFNKREGYFILFNDFVYDLRSRDASIFFSNVQDYWLKKPFGNGLNTEKQIEFTLGQGEELYKLRIPFVKDFQIEILDSEKIIVQENFVKLFLVVFGANEDDQAFRVSELTKKIGEQIDRQSTLKLNLHGKTLYLFRQRDEVLVVDTLKNVVFHYLSYNADNLSLKLKDYIK